jgi:adenylosuccinate synthase
VTEDFPATLDEVERAEPVTEVMPGWGEDIRGVKHIEALPDACRRYIDRLETLVDVPAAFLSTGPGRDETIMVRDPFST